MLNAHTRLAQAARSRAKVGCSACRERWRCAPHGVSRKGGYWSVTKTKAYAVTRLPQRSTPSTKSNRPRQRCGVVRVAGSVAVAVFRADRARVQTRATLASGNARSAVEVCASL